MAKGRHSRERYRGLRGQLRQTDPPLVPITGKSAKCSSKPSGVSAESLKFIVMGEGPQSH